MKYGVSPNTLLITAGTIWSLAGVNILRIGLTCWIDDQTLLAIQSLRSQPGIPSVLRHYFP